MMLSCPLQSPLAPGVMGDSDNIGSNNAAASGAQGFRIRHAFGVGHTLFRTILATQNALLAADLCLVQEGKAVGIFYRAFPRLVGELHVGLVLTTFPRAVVLIIPATVRTAEGTPSKDPIRERLEYGDARRDDDGASFDAVIG